MNGYAHRPGRRASMLAAGHRGCVRTLRLASPCRPPGSATYAERDYAILFANVISNGNTVGQWFELPSVPHRAPPFTIRSPSPRSASLAIQRRISSRCEAFFLRRDLQRNPFIPTASWTGNSARRGRRSRAWNLGPVRTRAFRPHLAGWDFDEARIPEAPMTPLHREHRRPRAFELTRIRRARASSTESDQYSRHGLDWNRPMAESRRTRITGQRILTTMERSEEASPILDASLV